MNLCERRGPLSRTGTAQPERDIAERRADHFKLDERDVADLILFGRRFARQMKYYAPDGALTGHWGHFFDSDISAILAAIARLPVEPFRRALADAQAFLVSDPSRPAPELQSHFAFAFQLPLVLLRELTIRIAPLEPEHALHRSLVRLIEQSIGPRLAELAAYHRGAADENVILATALNPADFSIATILGPGPQIADEVANLVFAEPIPAFADFVLPDRVVGGFAPGGWNAFYMAQNPDTAPYTDGADLYAQIFDALNYNLLVKSIERIFQTLARARAEAKAQLKASLEDFAAHTPHYGLWLAFLSMFDRARDELNGITGRHMDFYYQEVLRLARKPPTPDQVHLLVELARGTEAHLLPAGTLVRAGKDAAGKDVAYALDEDFVANRAQVTELRAVRVENTRVAGKQQVRVRASPIAASADGLGAQLPEEDPHFAPFGPDNAPFARIGFAVADRQLFLREGRRRVLFRFSTTQPGALSPLNGFRIRLTAEEGWLELPTGNALRGQFASGQVIFILTLNGDHPAIVGHDPALHQGPYPAGVPVAEILLDWDGNETAAARAMALLRNATRSKINIRTEAEGLRRMSIRTDDGEADPAAGFLPFGAAPRKNGQWIIGSAEVFSRPLSSLTINVTWAEPYLQGHFFEDVTVGDYGVSVDYLRGGEWRNTDTSIKPLALGGAGAQAITESSLLDAPRDAALVLEDELFAATHRSGFLRMRLNRSFGHRRYLDAKTLALIELASGGGGAQPIALKFTAQASEMLTPGLFALPGIVYGPDGLPRPPYTPEVTGITLDYTAAEAEAADVWRILPFGIEPATSPGRILAALPYEGALFLGIDALDPPETLSLLVQVADGTGDPLLELPTFTHHWLGDTGWINFENQMVVDRSDNLAGSGLLSYAMPEGAVTHATEMPAGLHWLRLSVDQNAQAVNRLHLVAAQGVKATFVDRGNDPAFLEEPLPAGTITKLLRPEPLVKGLSQPFASIGGRGQEDREGFRRRVSERLRHKDRAVSVWDYEQLALEALPRIYRAKCLNHTELKRENAKVVTDNELAPGAVTFVAVPYTLGRDLRDPLRPYADRATLRDLHDHLSKRCSPFVRLKTANPKFEEIHISMKVAFRKDITDTDFYRLEIEKALIEHLTPWRKKGASGVEFGGRVYKSTVIDFVEELAFVDYLEEVKMFHQPDPQGPTPQVDVEIIRATTARSVLVSARSHRVGLV
jgi:hypothetical protein